MSSDYRLNLIWTSQGQQLRADIERNIGSLTQMDRTVSRHTRNLGLWGQQMRAVGTTLRYALAGASVYAVASAVTGLGQFLDRLGQIDALAARVTSEGRLQSLGRDLNILGDHAVQLANTWGIATDEIMQHQERFFSSFQQKGRQGIVEANAWATQMTQLMLALGGEVGDPTALSAGVAGFVQGMGPQARARPARSAQFLSDIIAQVIQETPGILGTDIARDIGRLAGAQTALRMTPEQIFAVYGTAARAGGSSAVIGRGITQLLTASLVNPRTEEERKAFKQFGLPSDPGALRNLGGWKILMQLMERFPRPSQEAATALQQIEDPEEALAGAGVPRAQINAMFSLFGRMESARQFMNLLAVGGKDALQDFIDGIEEATEIHRAEQMARIRNEQRTYQQLGQTWKNVGLTVARGFDPAIRPIARRLTDAGEWLTRQNPSAIAGGAAGLGAAAIASRLVFGGGIAGLAGRGLSRIPGVGPALARLGLGGVVSRAPALGAAALVGGGLGAFEATGLQGAGSRSNPFWVVIDPLSWFMPGAPSGTGIGAGGGPTAGPTGGGRRGLFRRAAPLGLALGAAAVAASPLIAAERLSGDREEEERRQRFNPRIHRALALARMTDAGAFRARGKEADILNLYRSERITAAQANRRLMRLERYQEMLGGGVSRVGGTGAGFVQQVEGEASVRLMLDATPELAAALVALNREEHVPVKLWAVGSGGSPPTFRGQRKTQRRGGP